MCNYHLQSANDQFNLQNIQALLLDAIHIYSGYRKFALLLTSEKQKQAFKKRRRRISLQVEDNYTSGQCKEKMQQRFSTDHS